MNAYVVHASSLTADTRKTHRRASLLYAADEGHQYESPLLKWCNCNGEEAAKTESSKAKRRFEIAWRK